MEWLTDIAVYFDQMEQQFDRDELVQFCKTDYAKLHGYHYSLGLWIRDTLLKEGELTEWFERHHIYEKDDMSSFIIRLFYLYEQERILL